MLMISKQTIVWWLIWIACSFPLVYLAYLLAVDGMGVNPITASIQYLGDWSIRFLIVCLLLSPLRAITRWVWPMRIRRMIGIWTFVYVLLHFLMWICIDQFFDWDLIWKDILKRPFITLGMVPFLLLMPLTITSTNGWIKRLGWRKWKNLHKLIYLIAVLACLHYWLLTKSSLTQPLFYSFTIAILLGYRLIIILKNRSKEKTSSSR